MNPPAPTVAPPRAPAEPRRPELPDLCRSADAYPPAAQPREVATPDDWPHTTRVLPWMLAGFIALLWLVPFNSISLRYATPIDLHLDRIVLPFILLTWVLTEAVGARATPSRRATPIHAMIGLFVAIAFLSVVLDGAYLTRTLDYGEAIKKLSLLASYVLLFLMIASVIRQSELKAFMSFTLGLAVLCAVGTLWEYRFHHNLFYDWSGKLLPHQLFVVPHVDSSGFDAIGRRITMGPAELGLECAAMLAMGLPLALVRLMHASVWRQRIMYGLAFCLILAATASTYRKTAFLAPLAIILTIGIFRRRELLRIAPLGLVVLVLVHLMAPGALGGVSAQLKSNRLETNTVDDRASDYDAVRPDVLSHLLIGRGYGSYEQTRARILDSEFLHRLVEVGVLGLAAYLAMIGSVIASMRATIRSRHPDRAPPALICAAAASGFFVVSFLFDAMSFPHTPYIFLMFAGFAAVLYQPPERPGAAMPS